MRASRSLTLCLWLSLVGLGLCAFLFGTHLGLQRGELLGGPACSGSGAFNCHAVTGGAWGRFLGVPLPLWGLVGYLAAIALTLLARQSAEWESHALVLLSWLALAFVGADLALLTVMMVVIRAYCLFCLLTYAVNLLLFLAAYRALPPPRRQAFGRLGAALGALVPSGRQPATFLFWGLLLTAVGTAASLHAATTYVARGTLGSAQKQIREYVLKQPRVSVRTTGDPAMGPANARLTLVEFSDFFCPSCQRASKMNAIILANHRRDTQFIFKHFPLDTTCNSSINRMVHPGACQAAAATECAHLQGKFWPFHDRIFEKGDKGSKYRVTDLERDAERLGLDVAQFRACLDSGQGMEAVKQDVAEGARLGVTSTPTYIINGVPMAGGITPAVFEEIAGVLRERP